MATVSFIYLEIYLIPKDFLYILVLSVGLSFLDKRLICLSYSGGLLVLLNFFTTYPKIKSFEIMIVISILHIIESVLIILNGRSQWEVKYFRQNNIIVGGLVFNRFYPIPFLVFIGDTMIRPIVLIAILSYSDFTTSSYPREKIYKTSIMIFTYSSILLLITLLYKNNLLSSIFALLGHEVIIYINILKEKINKPIYTEPFEGIRVLKVERRSIARKIGIREGDIILKVNRLPVENEEDLLDLMRAYKSELIIEYFNLRKGLIQKKYKGKEKTLGIKTFPKVDF